MFEINFQKTVIGIQNLDLFDLNVKYKSFYLLYTTEQQKV